MKRWALALGIPSPRLVILAQPESPSLYFLFVIPEGNLLLPFYVVLPPPIFP
jgi:hypothetical protein